MTHEVSSYVRPAPVPDRVYTPDQASEVLRVLRVRRDLTAFALWGFVEGGSQFLGYALGAGYTAALKVAKSEYLFVGELLVIKMDKVEIALLTVVKSSTPSSALRLRSATMNNLDHTPAEMLRLQVLGVDLP